MKRFVPGVLSAILLGATGTASSAEIDVMTQNQYLGADLTPIIAAGAADPFDPVAFNAAVVTALQAVAANLPEQRLQSLAKLIRNRSPHLVGLQEVFSYSCIGPGCADPSVAGAFNDHLAETLAALGGTYVVEASVTNLNLTLPVQINGLGALVTVTDRDVILSRGDVASGVEPVNYDAYCGHPSAFDEGCNYTVVGEVALAGQTVRIERGFVGVDATIGGKPYRFINTHLEVREPQAGNPYSRVIQMAQAAQLLATIVPTLPAGRTLLVSGDINSDPRDPVIDVPLALQPLVGVPAIIPPYLQFAATGFTDAWTRRPGASQGQGAPLVGFSCCQDEDLSNHKSALYERIDMIFSLTPPKKVKDARLLGESVADKTWPPGLGLWPSDHASVAARLQY